MKKRVLSALMALAMCLTLLPTAALAEEEHQHCVCGKTSHVDIGDHTEESQITFDKWLDSWAGSGYTLVVGGKGSTHVTDGDSQTLTEGKYVLTGGNYYLKKDVTIEHPIQIDGDVTICLNGKEIKNVGKTTGSVFEVPSGKKLTLTNCTGNTGNGRIVCENGSGVYVSGGTLNLYSGQIANSKGQTGTDSNTYGGGVYVTGIGTFNMYGGVITGNRVNYGGGVYVKSGTFTMYGGTIQSNHSSNGSGSSSSGGGVYVEESGNFIMKNDASVTANKIEYGSTAGAGVYVNGGTFEMHDNASVTGNEASNRDGSSGCGVYVSGGKFEMNDNASVSGNTATYGTLSGGGVYVKSGTFTMNGNASVTDNTADQGGGVYASVGTFTMSGGSITGNKGNGVYVSDTANTTFTVSGAPTVTGNTRNSAASNVFLAGSKTITIGGELTGSPNSIGVTRGAYLVIANNVNEDYSGIFFSDNTQQYVVKYDEPNSQLVLAEKSGGTTNPPVTTEHKHFLCGGKTACNEVGGHSCEATTFATKLWMAGGVLKKGNDVWKKGTVNRADGGAVSHEGYVLTTGNYYLDDNLTLNGAAILIDGDVKLCLNGHTIDRANGNAALDYVIRVLGKNEAHLTLTDCVGGGTIKGGGNGGVDIFGFCTLDMFGGTITGNTNSGVDVGQFGEFNMYGGKITGNSAGYGGGVYTYGKFTMSGGSITNNTATEKGGGVLVDGGTFTVSGSATVKDNTSGQNSIKDNVSLADNKFITIGEGGLKSDASIGVTTATEPTKENPVFITNETNEGYKNSFTSDKAGFDVQFINKYNRLALVKSGGSTPGGGTPEIVPVSQITLNKTSTSISVGNSEKLTAKVTPNNATDKSVTWTSSDNSVATVAPDGTVTAVKAGTATITATAEGGNGTSATCTVTVTGGTTPSQPSNPGGGSSSGGGGSSSGGSGSSDSNPIIKTETKNNSDGSTTKTETRKDGSVTATTTGKDGSTSKTETKKDGSSVTENKAADGSTGTVKTDKNGQTEAKTALSNKAVEDAKRNGEAVKAPVEVEASRNSNTAPTVKVELPKGAGETKVEIPVSNVKPGTVAVLVHPDGTEEILKNSIPTEDGIQLTVDGSATVKIVDNSKDFIDTRNHWAREEIDFVSARELVNGMSDTIYAPNTSATRAQLWTILARQNDANLSGGNTWYEKAQLWSKDKGISDGTEPNAAINRAQMVTMLWRTMGQPAATDKVSFADVPAGSYYAQAVAWAVESGITQGVGGGRFDPAATCTRAQIAAFLTRLYAEK